MSNNELMHIAECQDDNFQCNKFPPKVKILEYMKLKSVIYEECSTLSFQGLTCGDPSRNL